MRELASLQSQLVEVNNTITSLRTEHVLLDDEVEKRDATISKYQTQIKAQKMLQSELDKKLEGDFLLNFIMTKLPMDQMVTKLAVLYMPPWSLGNFPRPGVDLHKRVCDPSCQSCKSVFDSLKRIYRLPGGMTDQKWEHVCNVVSTHIATRLLAHSASAAKRHKTE